MFAFQTFVNVGVVTGILPNTGISLPFISYGGSNIMASLIAVGILVSIAFDNICPNYNVQYMNAIRSKLWFLPWNRQFRKNREES